MKRWSTWMFQPPTGRRRGLGVLRFLLLFHISIFSEDLLSQNWIQQQSGTTANLRGLWFVDSLSGWVCGDSGIILQTSNGGAEWVRQNSGVTLMLEDIFFWDSLSGWVAGDSGVILHTTNGGTTWGRQITNVSSKLTHIRFHTVGRGWATGTRATELRTTNWGDTWEGVAGDSSAPDMDSEYWIDDDSGARSLRGYVQYTTTRGPWCIGLSTDNRYYDIVGQQIEGVLSYWIVGKSAGFENEVLKMTVLSCPGGAAFQFSPTGDTLTLYDIYLTESPLTLYAVGEKGKATMSSDSGKTWYHFESPSTTDLYSISVRENYLYVAGDSGSIFRMQVITSVDVINTVLFGGPLIISSPYPNPTNASVTINYRTGRISVDVIDLLGRQVMKILDDTKQSGSYSINLDLGSLSSGVYFLKFKVKSTTRYVKIIQTK